MIDFEQSLKTELSAITGLSSKVFPLNAPIGTEAPYVTYESSGVNEDKALDGFLDTGELSCTVEVLGSTYASAKQLSPLIRTKIKSFIGRAIGNGGPFVQDVEFEQNIEMYEPNMNLFRVIINFTVYF